MYRTNTKGVFNVPYGGDDKKDSLNPNLLADCSSALKDVTLIAGDFEKVVNKAKAGDFVYMDPPFSVHSKEIFNEYDKSRFGMDDIIRLQSLMYRLNARGVQFLVSYADSHEADLLKEGFYYKKVSVRRSIAGFATKRKIVNEVMIYNKTQQ